MNPIQLIKDPFGTLLAGTSESGGGGGSSGGGETAFYQCASVDTAADIWTGREWVLENGIYSLSDTITEGLTIAGFEPVVGYSYSADTLIMAGKLYAGPDPMPAEGVVFHASLASNAPLAETGQALTEASETGATSITYQTYKGVPCAYFGGENNLTFVPGGDFPIGNNARSISLWFYTVNSEGHTTLFLYGNSEHRSGIAVNINNGKVELNHGYGYDGAHTDILTGAWHHAAFVKEADTIENGIYIDGVRVNTHANEWNSVAEAALIGGAKRSDGYNYYYTGYLAGIRVYNRALSLEEIQILAGEFTPEA